MAMSARRTSSSDRRGRSCWTPNAPGGGTRRSTSPSVSTTCCSSACGMRRPQATSSRPTTRCPMPTCRPRTGSRAPDWSGAALLPGLLLARVDGKSPVEYINDDAQRDVVRRVAGALLREPLDYLKSIGARSEEHTSELQSPCNLVCRLLLE